MPSIASIEETLTSHAPRIIETERRARAAVALILRGRGNDPEILFIERARHENDPWSGDLGFPGGRLEPGDPDLRSTAERETSEEIGLELRLHRYLGRLDDLAGAHLPIVVSCFVYAMDHPTPLVFSEEVAKSFWIPFSHLCDPRRHDSRTVYFRGAALVRPAIDLLGPGHRVLWGITYRLIVSFLELLKCFPPSPRKK